MFLFARDRTLSRTGLKDKRGSTGLDNRKVRYQTGKWGIGTRWQDNRSLISCTGWTNCRDTLDSKAALSPSSVRPWFPAPEFPRMASWSLYSDLILSKCYTFEPKINCANKIALLWIYIVGGFYIKFVPKGWVLCFQKCWKRITVHIFTSQVISVSTEASWPLSS